MTDCRLFLSTDAGGVGLNLQFASVVVNVDLPWNPAVLNQRIGRVHRLGQRNPVRVVNVVAKGTIEEGMLSVLAFKSSLFAGVLDGGAADVQLGGTRLTKFMESVEATTAEIPERRSGGAGRSRGSQTRVLREAPTQRRGRGRRTRRPVECVAACRHGSHRTLDPTHTQRPVGRERGEGSLASLVRTDEKTGEPYLRLPVPPPEVLEQAVGALSKFLGGLAAPDACVDEPVGEGLHASFHPLRLPRPLFHHIHQ